MPNRARRLRAERTRRRHESQHADAPAREAGRRTPGSGGERGAAGKGVRLQRVMAEAGVAARRVCEQMIAAGRVEVNGRVVTALPIFVDPGADSIVVDGRPLPRGRAAQTGRPDTRRVYVMFNKPPRVMTTLSDDAGRTCVGDLVKHPAGVRLVPVGRLEFHSAGLVLMTNDGDLVHRLTHARFGVPRVFEVAVRGVLAPDFVEDLGRGLNLKAAKAAREAGVDAGEVSVRRLARDHAGSSGEAFPTDERGVRGPSNPRTTLEITLRRVAHAKLGDMLAEAGVQPIRIVQTALGNLRLARIAPGGWRELDREEIRALRRTGDRSGQASRSSARPSGPRGARRPGGSPRHD